jgi:hypothetical protein
MVCEDVHGDVLPEVPHEILLFTGDDEPPELVYRAPSGEEAVAWVREWLREPLGVMVGIRASA